MKWKLAACRINKGLKQKEVAELMHTSNTTIVNHETGKVKPTIAQKKMYSEIYGVPEDDIVRFENERSEHPGQRNKKLKTPEWRKRNKKEVDIIFSDNPLLLHIFLSFVRKLNSV